MAWPGDDPLAFYRGLIDDVDGALAELLARRLALTRAVQDHKPTPPATRTASARSPRRWPGSHPRLGADRLGRIMQLVIGELLEVAQHGEPGSVLRRGGD